MAARRKSGAWAAIVEQSVKIVDSYDTGVTLRQLFYRLVSTGVLRNTQSEYSQLSSKTAEARRAGTFPALIDRGRSIHRFRTWNSPREALTATAQSYRRDRTEGQPVTLYLGVEKAGIVEQLLAWFGDLGFPIVATAGYTSQTFIDVIEEDAQRQGRPTVMLYAGDFDPSGEDILRDLNSRSSFDTVERIALDGEQVDQFNLPPMPGKTSDTRATAFIERHGKLVQVEIDALPPDVLRTLYTDAIDKYHDVAAYNRVLERESQEREEALAIVRRS